MTGEQPKYGYGQRSQKVPIHLASGQTVMGTRKVGRKFVIENVKAKKYFQDNYGVTLQSSKPINDNTYRGLENSLRFVSQVVPLAQFNKLHSLSVVLDGNFSKSQIEKQGIRAKYSPPSRSIHLSPKYEKSFMHEYGHFLDHMVTMSGNTKYIKEANSFKLSLQAVPMSGRTLDLLKQRKAPESNVKQVMDSLQDPDELFARYFEQYISHQLFGKVNKEIMVNTFEEYEKNPRYFTANEFLLRKDAFENLLTKSFGDDVIEKVLNFFM